MNNHTKTMIYQMAKKSQTELTKKHLAILEFCDDYYRKHKVGPLYYILETKMDINRSDLHQMFPKGLYSVYNWLGIPIQGPHQLCKSIAEVEVDNKKKVYFNHAATTYLRKEVKQTLFDFYNSTDEFGNPSCATFLGKAAFNHIYEAREHIARSLKVGSSEIVFTGGGSEANNTAIKGIAFKHLEQKGHIISSVVEHSSVLKTLDWLESIGFEVTWLTPDSEGIITPDQVAEAITDKTILVSLMAVNNEIGVINPFREIGAVCKEKQIPFMVDAVQAYGKIPLSPKEDHISLLSISGHKVYAPKGIGALFIDEELEITPLIHGGEQEFSIRAGTEDVAAIKAFGRASILAFGECQKECDRLKELQTYFLKKLDDTVEGYIINGSLENRVPNNLSVGFPEIDSGALLLSLNQIGVFVSSGSACTSGSKEGSHVIKALGVDTDRYGIIRFSFGLYNLKEDVDYLFRYLPEILKQLRQMDKEESDNA